MYSIGWTGLQFKDLATPNINKITNAGGVSFRVAGHCAHSFQQRVRRGQERLGTPAPDVLSERTLQSIPQRRDLPRVLQRKSSQRGQSDQGVLQEHPRQHPSVLLPTPLAELCGRIGRCSEKEDSGEVQVDGVL